jgi:hypothetical protein
MVPAKLIDALGGATAIARELSLPTTTVHSWKRANAVPAWRQGALLKLARDKGIAITGFANADAPPAEPEARTVTCIACDRRLDDDALRACTDSDCPNADREAA